MSSPSDSDLPIATATSVVALPLHQNNGNNDFPSDHPSSCQEEEYFPQRQQPAAPTSTSISPISGCFSVCWNFLRCLNTFAVAILAGAVTFLFFQVQALQISVKSEQDQVNSLNSRLANQTNVQIQALTDAVNEEHAFTLYQMAGMFALLACLLTAFHMYSHLRNYKEPLVQRKIVTILWMSPIYAVTSFLSLIFPVADGYLAVIKDFYEGTYW
jgi:Organic solute transporter Ostalpha